MKKVLLRFKPTISSTIKHHTFPHAADLLNISASARSRNVNPEIGKQKLNSLCLKEKKIKINEDCFYPAHEETMG